MAVDIESTVAAAVEKCCADTSVTKEVRRERISGLLKLGKIYAGKLPSLATNTSTAAPSESATAWTSW